MFSIGAGKEDTNVPRATVQGRGENKTEFFIVESLKFIHVPAPEDTVSTIHTVVLTADVFQLFIK